MVQMPNTLSKIYMMGQRSKVAAIESSRWISDATPEIQTDLRDGIIRRLDLSPNGIPSTRVTLSFSSGLFEDATKGFRLQLIQDGIEELPVGQTECIYPANSDPQEEQQSLENVMDAAFNSIPGWVGAGNVWILTSGEASVTPSTSLSYTMYFDNQLPMGLSFKGDTTGCGDHDLEFKIERDSAPNNRPIYHRLHDLPGGFPDVLITEPRSLGPLADDPKILARQFIDSDPGEATPLGRAELMKLISLLTGSEATGNALFETIETRYNDAKAIASKAKYRPTVMVGKPGTWNEAARNSWMITVGSTYVGEFLRDANVEYRNSDDSVNQAICGSGCGACPSGTSDTRCSVNINDYLNLFRHADYWMVAGIGANCWSGSCNFEISSESLLDQNQDIYSQFLPMQCGSLIGLDKSQMDGTGNTYWELGRVRPDLVLMDLVTLMHPDVGIQEETTFFRMLPPLSDSSGVPTCPRTLLPESPEAGTVHVTSVFTMDVSNADPELIGASRFAVLEKLYPTTNAKLAEAVGVEVSDLEIAMANQQFDDAQFSIAVTVRVSNCQDHVCGAEIGTKLNAIGPELETALELDWVTVQRDASMSTVVLDKDGDIIPLDAIVVVPDSGSDSLPDSSSTTTSNADNAESEPDKKCNEMSGGAILGIGFGLLPSLMFLAL